MSYKLFILLKLLPSVRGDEIYFFTPQDIYIFILLFVKINFNNIVLINNNLKIFKIFRVSSPATRG